MAANEASLAMCRRGWSQPPEHFEARAKYLQLADKAARTVMMLTERLDHHRGRGQQQITVKHVTTNNVMADQAIIADSVTTGSAGGNGNIIPFSRNGFDLADEGGDSLIDGGVGFLKLSLGVVHDQSSSASPARVPWFPSPARCPIFSIRFGSASPVPLLLSGARLSGAR